MVFIHEVALFYINSLFCTLFVFPYEESDGTDNRLLTSASSSIVNDTVGFLHGANGLINEHPP